MGPNPMTSVLIRRKKRQAEKEKSRGEDDLKMEAETEGMFTNLQEKDGKRSLSESLEGTNWLTT